MSYREAHRQTGIATDTLARRFPREQKQKPPGQAAGSEPSPGPAPAAGGKPKPDPAPKPHRGPRRSKGPTDEQLAGLLSKAAVAPAIPMALYVHCDFCANHFATNGPKAAAELVEMSHEFPELREILEGLYGSWRRYAWAGVIAGYLGVPVLHHLTPRPLYSAVAPFVGMPPRGSRTNGVPPHAHPAPAGVAADPRDEPGDQAGDVAAPVDAGMFDPTMFDNLDTDQLIAQARAMGMEIDPDELAAAMAAMRDGTIPATNGAGPETDSSPTAGAEPAEAETPPAEGDPDPE